MSDLLQRVAWKKGSVDDEEISAHCKSHIFTFGLLQAAVFGADWLSKLSSCSASPGSLLYQERGPHGLRSREDCTCRRTALQETSIVTYFYTLMLVFCCRFPVGQTLRSCPKTRFAVSAGLLRNASSPFTLLSSLTAWGTECSSSCR